MFSLEEFIELIDQLLTEKKGEILIEMVKIN